MTSYLIAGLCIAGMVLIYRLLEFYIGSGRAKFHDLTRAGFAVGDEWHPAVCPVTRQRRNDLTVDAYGKRRDALGHGALRPVPVRPEPRQIAAWEDDGGACA